MAVTLTSTNGLFTALGKIYGAIRSTNGQRGDTAPASSGNWGSGGPAIKALGTQIDDIRSTIPSGFANLYDGIYQTKSSMKTQQRQYISDLTTLARNLVVEMVHADANLPQKTEAYALRELVRQMVASSDSVEANSVSVSVSAGGSNVGTCQINATVKGPNGVNREYVYAENIEVTCTTDQFTGTLGNEVFSAAGELAESDKFATNWPDGSGCSSSLTMIDYEGDQSAGNYLTNSDFQDWTGSTPAADDWTILVGTAGTSVVRESSTVYSGTYSMEFISDGSSLLSIAQPFASSGTYALKPATVYSVCFYTRAGSAQSAGVLKVDLVNSANSNVADDAGNANEVSVTLSSESTSAWTEHKGFFRTPSNLPTGCKIRIRTSTAHDNTESIFIGGLSVGLATEAYPGGPYLAAHRGSTAVLAGDIWTVAVSNGWGSLFQLFFAQLFDMATMGVNGGRLQLPSDGSPTVADSLVG